MGKAPRNAKEEMTYWDSSHRSHHPLLLLLHRLGNDNSSQDAPWLLTTHMKYVVDEAHKLKSARDREDKVSDVCER
jgi:hypothetical protein